MNKKNLAFGSEAWAKNYGENSLSKIIQIVNKSNFEQVIGMFDFYTDGRTRRGAVLTAIKHAPKLANCDPYFMKDGMLFSLSWVDSVQKGKPVYLPMLQQKKEVNS